ncbi:hypothetical protein [Haloterrigena alkaliphila]|uniref:Uncharacterized protein n=1 Tax=Haloterrigena alkaliphila TaxID=2816475 RepID=A0A8A2VBT7_9EURY|nr:hypothetical protein [Haloterrigena alkaliphila]QSW98626.1 hypothetical protein J0X25_14685 [Haloterrigena alkaliphila]
MDDQSTDRTVDQGITRSVPGSFGVLAPLLIAGLAVIGIWGFVDGQLGGSGEYLTSTLGVLAVTLVVVGALIVVGARSKRWLEGPYW